MLSIKLKGVYILNYVCNQSNGLHSKNSQKQQDLVQNQLGWLLKKTNHCEIIVDFIFEVLSNLQSLVTRNVVLQIG